MKNLTLLLMTILFSIALSAQGDSKWPSIDKSVLDIAYYPQTVAFRNYLSAEERESTPKIKLLFSRPKMNGRTIFGGLVSYGKEWRLGANEATMITFYQPVRIGKVSLGTGTYTVFAEPNEEEWTFHISSQTGIWGNANRDSDKNVVAITVPVSRVEELREELSMTFQEIDDLTTHLIVEWEHTRAALPINFNPIQHRPMDVSPLDMAHYPDKSAYTNYLEGEEKNMTPKIQVTYSRPAKKERDIFGTLLKDTKVWRVGANEATEIAFFQNVSIGDTEIARGRYALFAELNGSNWNLIFSKDYPIWGVHDRDEAKDIAKVSVPVTHEDEVVEHLSIIFEEQSSELVYMVIAWDKTRVEVPIAIKK